MISITHFIENEDSDFSNENMMGPHRNVEMVLANQPKWDPNEMTPSQRLEQLNKFQNELQTAPDFQDHQNSMKRFFSGSTSNQLNKTMEDIKNEREKMEYLANKAQEANDPNKRASDLAGENGGNTILSNIKGALPYIVGAGLIDRAIFNGVPKLLQATKKYSQQYLSPQQQPTQIGGFLIKPREKSNEELLRSYYRN